CLAGKSLRYAVLVFQHGQNPHLFRIGAGSCPPGALRFTPLADISRRFSSSSIAKAPVGMLVDSITFLACKH
ncbi:hypothetical protein NPJ88_014970, partial [Halomonas elongata]|uniref:hypothetical protein n=1 Tax=Halomonas elongata TaxID=2746 RepID=UPI00255B1C23